jgi:hypothetical protein
MSNRVNKTVTRAQRIANPRLFPRLLPIKGAAEWLGLTVWAMRERIWAGQIPVVQFPGGRKMYVDVEDLEKFIQGNKRVIS